MYFFETKLKITIIKKLNKICNENMIMNSTLTNTQKKYNKFTGNSSYPHAWKIKILIWRIEKNNNCSIVTIYCFFARVLFTSSFRMCSFVWSVLRILWCMGTTRRHCSWWVAVCRRSWLAGNLDPWTCVSLPFCCRGSESGSRYFVSYKL